MGFIKLDSQFCRGLAPLTPEFVQGSVVYKDTNEIEGLFSQDCLWKLLFPSMVIRVALLLLVQRGSFTREIHALLRQIRENRELCLNLLILNCLQLQNNHYTNNSYDTF